MIINYGRRKAIPPLPPKKKEKEKKKIPNLSSWNVLTH